MAERLCDRDRRNVTEKNFLNQERGQRDSESQALRKTLALYLRNWKKGYCAGRRERIINILEGKMKEEVYLTTLELISTSGFIKIMSIIWMPFIFLS